MNLCLLLWPSLQQFQEYNTHFLQASPDYATNAPSNSTPSFPSKSQATIHKSPSNSTPSFPGKSKATMHKCPIKFNSRHSLARVRQALPYLHSVTMSTALPLPHSPTPLGYSDAQVFQLSLKAIHYVNGDDGYLLAEAVSWAVGVYLGYCTLLKVLPVDQDDLVGFCKESQDAI